MSGGKGPSEAEWKDACLDAVFLPARVLNLPLRNPEVSPGSLGLSRLRTGPMGGVCPASPPLVPLWLVAPLKQSGEAQ